MDRHAHPCTHAGIESLLSASSSPFPLLLKWRKKRSIFAFLWWYELVAFGLNIDFFKIMSCIRLIFRHRVLLKIFFSKYLGWNRKSRQCLAIERPFKQKGLSFISCPVTLVIDLGERALTFSCFPVRPEVFKTVGGGGI